MTCSESFISPVAKSGARYWSSGPVPKPPKSISSSSNTVISWLSSFEEWARPLYSTHHPKKPQTNKAGKIRQTKRALSPLPLRALLGLCCVRTELNGRHNWQSFLAHRFQQESCPATCGHAEGHQGVSQLARFRTNLDQSHWTAVLQGCSTWDAPHHPGEQPGPCPSSICPQTGGSTPAGGR